MVKKWGIELEPPYYLDPQQGIVSKTGKIEKCYICYPMPLQLSMRTSDLALMMDQYIYEPSLPLKEEIDKRLFLLRERIGSRLGSEVATSAGLKECLKVVKGGDPEEVNVALSQILHCVAKQGVLRDITPKSRIELIVVLENLLGVIDRESLGNPPNSLKRLYTARLIEACLFQTGEGIIGGFSYLRSRTDIKNQRVGSKELERTHSEETLKDILFIKMGRQILQDEMKVAWNQVVSYLPALSDEDKNKVKNLFHFVDSMGGATQFVNVTLLRLLKEHPDDLKAFFQAAVELSETLKPSIEKALQIHSVSQDIQAQSGAFSRSDQIKKSLPRLEEKLKEVGLLGGESSIVETFNGVSSDAKLLLIGAVRECVTAFDQMIKSCTGSTDYESHLTQVSDFLSLLYPYREMMQVIARMCGHKMELYSSPESLALPVSLGNISEREAEQLKEISSNFNVAQLINGVCYTITAPQPATSLEEKFTFFHQTMESFLVQLAIQNGFTSELLPTELQNVITKVFTRTGMERKSLVGIEIEGDLIKTQYKIPLRDHAATVNITYDRSQTCLQIKLNIDGGNEESRWDSIKVVGEKLRDYLKMDLEIKSNDCGVEIVFKKFPIEGGISSEHVGEILGKFIEQSFQPSCEVISVTPHDLQTEEQFIDYISRNVRVYFNYIAEKFLSDEVFNKGIEKTEWNITNIPKKYLNEKLVLKAVRKNFQALISIPPEFISEAVATAALDQSMDAFRYIPVKMQTEELALKAVLFRGRLLQFVSPELRSRELVDAAVNKSMDTFKYVPKEMQTEEMCLSIVQKDGEFLQYVRDELKTKAVIEAAFNKTIRALDFIPKEDQTVAMKFKYMYQLSYLQTKDSVLESVKEHGELLEAVRSNLMSMEVINAALNQNSNALQFVPKAMQTFEIVLDAVQKNGRLIKHVRSDLVTPALIEVAALQNIDYIRDIPKESLSQEVVMRLVENNWRALEWIDPRLLNGEIVQVALRQSSEALQFIPLEFQTPAVPFIGGASGGPGIVAAVSRLPAPEFPAGGDSSNPMGWVRMEGGWVSRDLGDKVDTYFDYFRQEGGIKVPFAKYSGTQIFIEDGALKNLKTYHYASLYQYLKIDNETLLTAEELAIREFSERTETLKEALKPEVMGWVPVQFGIVSKEFDTMAERDNVKAQFEEYLGYKLFDSNSGNTIFMNKGQYARYLQKYSAP